MIVEVADKRHGRLKGLTIIDNRGYYRPMTMKSVATNSEIGVLPATALFDSLSDPTRLTIVRRLALGEARVADLVTAIGLAQSTVSAHLACLRGCGLVVGRPEGRQTFYSLARPELLDLLVSAEKLLAATGNAVALCPTYGTERASVTSEQAKETAE